MFGTWTAFADGIKPVHSFLLGGDKYTVYTGLLALALNFLVAIVVQALLRTPAPAPRAARPTTAPEAGRAGVDRRPRAALAQSRSMRLKAKLLVVAALPLLLSLALIATAVLLQQRELARREHALVEGGYMSARRAELRTTCSSR